MAITFTGLDYTGTPTADEQRVAATRIKDENARRASLDPPLPVLPTGTNPQKKASFLTAMMHVLQSAMDGWVKQARQIDDKDRKAGWAAAPQSVQDQIDALLAPYIPQ